MKTTPKFKVKDNVLFEGQPCVIEYVKTDVRYGLSGVPGIPDGAILIASENRISLETES